MTEVNNNVKKMIDLYKKHRDAGMMFFSIKPRIDDPSMRVAHVYSSGGELCKFNMPEGDDFGRLSRSYERYAYGKYQFEQGRGFDYVFKNMDALMKTLHNRANDKYNWEQGIGDSGTASHHNHIERMNENIISACNYKMEKDHLAVIDMEYTVPLVNGRKAKADLICASLDEEGKVHFYIIEYKCTKSGCSGEKNSLKHHFDDMSQYAVLPEIVEHLIITLQERVRYGLLECSPETASSVEKLSAQKVITEILFLFSEKEVLSKNEKLNSDYNYIAGQSIEIPVRYMYIDHVKKDSLTFSNLKKFELGNKFIWE